MAAHRSLLLGIITLLAAGAVQATVDIDTITVEAVVVQQIGATAATATDIRRNPQRAEGFTSEALAALTAPASTVPLGQPGDTQFFDAHARAYQTALGFNATQVDGGFANALGHNRLSATTRWSLAGFVRPRIGLVETARLDYLLFPGQLGISQFGSPVQAGFRCEITLVADGSERFRLDAQVVLDRASGRLQSTLDATGPFAGLVSRGTVVRENVSHETALTEAYLGSAELGSFTDQTEILLTYTMEAWMVMPGWELAGLAQVGDPFALSTNPHAELARAFPGLNPTGFSLSSTTAPVPEPAAAALLAAGLAGLAWRITSPTASLRWRRRPGWQSQRPAPAPAPAPGCRQG